MTDKTIDPLESFRAGVAEILGIDPDEVEIVVHDGVGKCPLCADGQHDSQTASHGGDVAE